MCAQECDCDRPCVRPKRGKGKQQSHRLGDSVSREAFLCLLYLPAMRRAVGWHSRRGPFLQVWLHFQPFPGGLYQGQGHKVVILWEITIWKHKSRVKTAIFRLDIGLREHKSIPPSTWGSRECTNQMVRWRSYTGESEPPNLMRIISQNDETMFEQTPF